MIRWLPWRHDPPIDHSQLERARRDLAKARADEPRIANLVEAHQRKQTENHFGARMHQAFGGRPQ